MRQPSLSTPPEGELLASPKPRVFERIVEFLTAEIQAGRLRPGDRLKPERELAAQFGVGRGTLREALKALEALDVLELRHGLGIYVTEPKPETLSRIFGTLLSMQPGRGDDIMDARIALECQAVRLACRNARAGDVRRMDEALTALAEASARQDGARCAQHDHDFHSAIMESTGNSTFVFLYSAITGLLKRSHHERWLTHFSTEDAAETLDRVHRAILAAIKAGDEEQAAAAMMEHFETIAERLARHARETGTTSPISIAFQPRRPR